MYGIGAYDYVQTRRHDAGYFHYQGYGPVQIEYFSQYPVAPLVFWTVNIVSGLAAVVLLLLRSRWAVGVAAVTEALVSDVNSRGGGDSFAVVRRRRLIWIDRRAR